MATSRDGCVVPTEPLAAIVLGFVDRWNRTKPSSNGRFDRASRRDDTTGLEATEWLAQETGLPRFTIDNLIAVPKKGPRKGRLGRNATTELRIADPIVQALEQPHVFHDGTLDVIPNPLATKQAQARCCGGSLNGSMT